MPIYEYACRKCKAHIEILQKMTDKPLTRCRKCGGKLEKQWSTSGIQFKGTGWYVTDYAGKKAEKKEAKEPEAKGEAKSEAKSEAKADGKSEGAQKSEPKSATKKSDASTSSGVKD